MHDDPEQFVTGEQVFELELKKYPERQEEQFEGLLFSQVKQGNKQFSQHLLELLSIEYPSRQV